MQPNFTASRMSGTAYGCNLCDSLCVSPHISVDIPSQIPYWSNIMSNTGSAWLHFQHNTHSVFVGGGLVSKLRKTNQYLPRQTTLTTLYTVCTVFYRMIQWNAYIKALMCPKSWEITWNPTNEPHLLLSRRGGRRVDCRISAVTATTAS